MDFKDLAYFVAVAEERNFSRAAEKLFVSQPTLSQTVARLEKRAATPLFNRMQHGLSLTEEGEAYAETARRILRLNEELNEEMRNITEGKFGRISFGISHYFSNLLLPKVLPEFHRRYSNVEITIHTETSSVLERRLLSGDLDLAVIVDSKSNDLMTTQVLFYEQILLAISPENPLSAQGTDKKGEEYPYLAPHLLQGQNFILSQEKMRLRQSAEAFFLAEGIARKVAVTSADIETANRLAAYNAGIAFIPSTFALSVKAPPKPVYFTTSSSLTDWSVGIAWLKRKSQNPMISNLVQLFKDRI